MHRDDEALAVLDKLVADTQDSPQQAFIYLEDKATWVLVPAARYAEALDTLDAAIKLVKADTIDWQSGMVAGYDIGEAWANRRRVC